MAIKLSRQGKKGSFDRSKALTNVVKGEWLAPHLIKASTEEFAWSYEFKPKGDDDAWHPSGHCLPTAQELYDLATRTPEEHEADRDKWKSMYRTFQVGHFWHQYFQELTLRLGFATPSDIEREGIEWWGELVPIKPEEIPVGYMVAKGMGNPKPYHWARGFADIAPCRIPGHGEAVVDFKSMGNHDFKRAEMPEWAAGKYEAQINIYMDFFDLDMGVIVAIQKDSPHGLKEFHYKRNQPLIDAIYNKWEHVSLCLADEVRPPDAHEDPLPLKGPIVL